ncbi:MAG: redoxin domain-containing protein, partial [Gemmataceae bacterium]|nr:redoxin domain-containing protein [Gemmataceae bacterium]
MIALLLLLGAGPPSPSVGFSLRDPAGRVRRLDSRVTVVVFAAVDCPLARLYAPRLAELSKRVPLVLIGSARDSSTDLARFAAEHRLPFPVLRDPGGAATARFGARRSPEAFVVQAGRVRYRGRIDDQ